MGSIENISELCRLCLISDQVNVPIFDENPTKEQTFVKINSCLPVKVSRDDSLPKKICDGCSYKLDMCYTFRNASVEAEKQLLELLNQAGLSACTDLMSSDPLASTKAEIMVKQETFEPIDARGDGDTSDMGLDSHNYMMQQQKLAYPQDFDYAEASGSATDVMTDEPAPKRAKRAAALNKAPVETDDDDLDAVMDISKVTKAEDEDSEDVDQPEYAEVPSTSADEQPGPSGVGKAAAEAPFECMAEALENSENESLKYQECLHCDKKFPSSSLMQMHLLVYHDNQDYTCEFCDFETSYKTTLERHTVFHHTKNFPFKCDLCPLGAFNKQDLNMHKKITHCVRFLCGRCSKGFKNYAELKQHDSVCETKFTSCPQCSKFIHKYKLKQHMEIHNENREGYVCEICGKKCANLSAVLAHRKTHSGERNFMCEVCGHTFLRMRHLVRHMIVHTRERPHKCSKCDKAYSQKSVLDIHMRTHTGEKPYKCILCPKRFSSLSGIFNHKRTH